MTTREVFNAALNGCFVSICAIFIMIPFWTYATDALIFTVGITMPIAAISMTLNVRNKK